MLQGYLHVIIIITASSYFIDLALDRPQTQLFGN